MSGGLFGGMDGMGSADGYGVVSLQKHRDPEFTMQTEDFPALPGAPGMGGGKVRAAWAPAPGCAGAFPRPRSAARRRRRLPGLGGAPKPGGEGYPGANGAAYGAQGAHGSRFGAAGGADAAGTPSRAAAPRTPRLTASDSWVCSA